MAEGTITANVLNIRSGNSTGTTVLGQFTKGNRVEITVQNYSADWHQIRYRDGIAYVYARYVKIDGEQSDEPDLPKVVDTGTVTSSILNIRTGPGTSYEKVGAFSKGDTVQITKQLYTANWHQILFQGSIRYVHKNYVKISTSSDLPEIVATGTVTSSILNIRTGPSTSYTKISRFSRGDAVSICTKLCTADWHEIVYQDQVAYVHKSLCAHRFR